ncbi:hypothetical protein PMG11_02981 [Penicillium brasilianum]|uniref:Uncharacterized protein n=1 Tax=Penicillium brasilianum TaxID=104259 RepID=A0A0F7TJ58_PENBI|nr:hypothetical protein PMG11_02981 [Penicillium brasilianum]
MGLAGPLNTRLRVGISRERESSNILEHHFTEESAQDNLAQARLSCVLENNSPKQSAFQSSMPIRLLCSGTSMQTFLERTDIAS